MKGKTMNDEKSIWTIHFNDGSRLHVEGTKLHFDETNQGSVISINDGSSVVALFRWEAIAGWTKAAKRGAK